MPKLKEETIIKNEINLCVETILQCIAPYWRVHIKELKDVDLWDFYQDKLNNNFKGDDDLAFKIKMALSTNKEIPTMYQSILLYPMTDFLDTTKLTSDDIKERQNMFLNQLKNRVTEIRKAKK